ncbi:MAG: M56 family metallopeptidase [Defluviitaleaceae bacterium]|nr:M56 family metallopeptidase [Defluviitaleaceae bacterium]
MTAIFIAILNMSITASVVALAVILVRIPLKKAPKIFSYALWGVVLFRLVFPFSIESAFSLMPTSTNIIPQDIVFSQNPTMQTGLQFIDAPVNTAIFNALPLIENGTIPIHGIFTVISYVWFAGFIVLLAYAVMGYVNLKRRIRFATLIQDNIYETDNIRTPFVFGFIRPKIYFPTTINPSRHDYILKHEQIHIKRRDYLIKPFAYIIFALHWFNLLMWVAYFLMSKDIEMSCDEAVLIKTDEDIRKNYSMSLLSLSVKRVSLLSPIAFASGESNVKERIANVLKFKRAARRISVVSIMVVSVFLVGFSSDRVWAFDAQLGLNNSTSTSSTTLGLTDWHTNERGFRIANPEEVNEFGWAILNTYFSAFRHDWENWENTTFYLMGGAFALELGGDYYGTFTRSGSVSGDINDIDARFRFSPLPFDFSIDSVTGALVLASYYPIRQYITSNINPLAYGFEDIHIVGNGSEAINIEFRKMIIDFSVRLLEQSGFANSSIISADIVAAWANFFDSPINPINIEVGVSFANGKNAALSFQAYETQFVLEILRFYF